MKGSIVACADNKGVVSGHDGNRYEFTRLEWSGNNEPVVGMEIDFTAEGSAAKSVFPIAAPPARHSKVLLAVVCWFVGLLGVHRLMVGKIGTGILMAVLSLSVVGLIVTVIWVFVDFVVILMGNFTDKSGNKITQ